MCWWGLGLSIESPKCTSEPIQRTLATYLLGLWDNLVDHVRKRMLDWIGLCMPHCIFYPISTWTMWRLFSDLHAGCPLLHLCLSVLYCVACPVFVLLFAKRQACVSCFSSILICPQIFCFAYSPYVKIPWCIPRTPKRYSCLLFLLLKISLIILFPLNLLPPMETKQMFMSRLSHL